MPLLSIIVPDYRVEAYLDRCVESIIAQALDDWELTLVNDGSPDRCPAMCDAWAQRDPHIRTIHKPNGGLSSARNAGLDTAHGEYITFVDSDDTLAPDTLRPNLDYLLRHPEADLVTYPIERNGKRIGHQAHDMELVRGTANAFKRLWYDHTPVEWSVCNKIFRRPLLDGIRFPEVRRTEDWLFTAKHLAERIHSVGLSPLGTYHYFENADSITHHLDAAYLRDIAEGHALTIALMRRFGLRHRECHYYVAAAIYCIRQQHALQAPFDVLQPLADVLLDANCPPSPQFTDRLYYRLIRLIGLRRFARLYATTHTLKAL